jgi:NTE family protein
MPEEQRIEEAVAAWERGRHVDLVFEGGGILGIGLVGAYAVLEEHGFRPQNLAGTSADAIVATLLAVGYTAAETKALILDLPFTQFTDPTRFGRLPRVGRSWLSWGLNLLWTHGLYRGTLSPGHAAGAMTEKAKIQSRGQARPRQWLTAVRASWRVVAFPTNAPSLMVVTC